MRLIDADKLENIFTNLVQSWRGKLPGPTYMNCLQRVKDAPTVDAVPVVRCGNCKHFREPFCVRRDDETHRERINMLTVDFCSYGERRTDV